MKDAGIAASEYIDIYRTRGIKQMKNRETYYLYQKYNK